VRGAIPGDHAGWSIAVGDCDGDGRRDVASRRRPDRDVKGSADRNSGIVQIAQRPLDLADGIS
jgi:hypothetical protein